MVMDPNEDFEIEYRECSTCHREVPDDDLEQVGMIELDCFMCPVCRKAENERAVAELEEWAARDRREHETPKP
jgi:hypothetical protein